MLQTKSEEYRIKNQFNELLKVCEKGKSKKNIEFVKKAFDFANEAHKPVRRKSGEPYIFHPLGVAQIVACEIGLGTKSIVSALLHDVVEDTDYTIEDINDIFGEKIALIVDGLTKIADVFNASESIQAENFRKMLLTLSDDVRVILIKLADRLHNMRTLNSMAPNKQLKIAGETLFLYAPLAHRLGLYAIKTELENLSFKYRHPEIYAELENKINIDKQRRKNFIDKFTYPIAERLKKENIRYEITGRPKSIYSIWNKMQTKNISFEEIYDLFAVRIVFEPKSDIDKKIHCWGIYSIITDIYMPKPDRIRDWVSTPKANGYEALHSTVMGPYGKWVEVQIRTYRMDEIAERGFAAHWKYKSDNSEEGELDKWIKKISELLENPNDNALEFLDDFKLALFASEIFVFTPKGHLKSLPAKSTVLDFAYEIHSEIGYHSIAAKINHNLVSLNHILKSGDQIEIITSDKQKPQLDWMEFVVTARAKSGIKNALKIHRKESIKNGKNILDDKLKEIKLHVTSNIIRKLLIQFFIKNKDELYYKIGEGKIELDNLKKILKKRTRNKWIKYWQLQYSKGSSKKKAKQEKNENEIIFDKKKPLLISENIENKTFNIAKCCNPIPGDDVIGYQENINSIVLHKTKCPVALKLNSSFGDKIVKVKWTTHKVLSFLSRIKLSGIDRLGIVNNVTNVISKQLDVNMRSINFESHDGIFEGLIDIYIQDTKDLNNLIMNLSKIKGIDAVKRIEITDE
ncbi:MAG: bifunctional (p)ppGpp synthetase/guanosine-3',5'-bis(diphosphate) 3'-pyrophosphohydrolase [Bacteroidales bacterium]|nr:bifunctional (p)ppGpp synthetase/guanosine-3',5'-bis(diphosphate) 3'-pyrophosphohydrolase [Bacteroidales bacterium]